VAHVKCEEEKSVGFVLSASNPPISAEIKERARFCVPTIPPAGTTNKTIQIYMSLRRLSKLDCLY
jgi:hypothetical protein